VKRAVAEFNASAVSLDSIYSADVEVFAPCALGAVVNDTTISEFKAEIICGAANNQLLEARHGELLETRGILYAPDYVANGGGVLSGGADLFDWPVERVRQRVLNIYDTVLTVFDTAKTEGIPTNRAADLLAERRLRQGMAQGSAR